MPPDNYDSQEERAKDAYNHFAEVTTRLERLARDQMVELQTSLESTCGGLEGRLAEANAARDSDLAAFKRTTSASFQQLEEQAAAKFAAAAHAQDAKIAALDAMADKQRWLQLQLDDMVPNPVYPDGTPSGEP